MESASMVSYYKIVLSGPNDRKMKMFKDMCYYDH